MNSKSISTEDKNKLRSILDGSDTLYNISENLFKYLRDNKKSYNDFVENDEWVYTFGQLNNTQKTYQITKKLFRIERCDDYSIYTKCSDNNERCEVCKNFAYRDWYEENNAKKIPILGMFDDSKVEYNRIWIQTCNLGIGIVLLSIGIYYQQFD
jgi:hypothetical protein